MKKRFLRHPKLKKLGKKWRRPRGKQNKLRKKIQGKGQIPSPGYGSPKNKRYIHPSGFYEVLISNVKDLKKVDPKKECIRIRSSVGKKKRLEIEKNANELKIKVLNPVKKVVSK